MNTLKKIRVAVMMGGPSAEHEVSLSSGREVLAHLDPDKYSCRAVVITREKLFHSCEIADTLPSPEDLASPAESSLFGPPLPPGDSSEIWNNTDVAFLALHGEFGEDGCLQGYLDTIGVPYIGSGVFASALAMNKIAAKNVFEANGLTTPPGCVIDLREDEPDLAAIADTHGFPCYVKCPQSGSSRLMGRADDLAQLKSLVAELREDSDVILVEANIVGDEYSCPVLEDPNGKTKVLPPILIRPKTSSYFDYAAKYTLGASEEITPAPCSQELTDEIQRIALKAHRVLNCRGVSRTDMIHKGKTLYVLETNTLPGLTPASLVPKSFEATGGTYAGLLDTMLSAALNRRGRVA